MTSTRRTFLLGAASIAALSALDKALAQTPEATVDPRMWGGQVRESEDAKLISWEEDEPELPGLQGWIPVSLMAVNTDRDAYVFVELRNVSGAPGLAPRLSVELLHADFSFGVHEEAADTPWVDAGSTALYYGLQFFGNSLSPSDWDGLNLSVAQETFRSYEEYDMSGLEIDDGQLVNNRPTSVGPVRMKVYVRDEDGNFCGGCSSRGTGANTPADGGSIRLGDPADPDYIPGCGFSAAGMGASEELGIGEPFTSEYRLVGFE